MQQWWKGPNQFNSFSTQEEGGKLRIFCSTLHQQDEVGDNGSLMEVGQPFYVGEEGFLQYVKASIWMIGMS